ncbi:hypothetical protein Q9L58_010576, partial [Maublancomyces gigas]
GVKFGRSIEVKLTFIWNKIGTGIVSSTGGGPGGFSLATPFLLFGGAGGKAGLGDVEEEDLPNDESAGKIQNESGLRSYLLAEGKSNDYIDKMIKDIK